MDDGSERRQRDGHLRDMVDIPHREGRQRMRGKVLVEIHLLFDVKESEISMLSSLR